MHLGIFHMSKGHVYVHTCMHLSIVPVFSVLFYEILVLDLSIFKSFVFKECEIFVAYIVSVFSQLIICLLTLFMVLFVIYKKK